jgi:hypothetical protein
VALRLRYLLVDPAKLVKVSGAVWFENDFLGHVAMGVSLLIPPLLLSDAIYGL